MNTITVRGSFLLKALRKIAPTILATDASKKTLPILSHFLMEVTDGGLKLSSCNMVETSTAEAGGIGINGQPWAVCPPYEAFKEWVGIMRGDTLTLSFIAGGRVLYVGAGRSKTEWKCIDAREFPPAKNPLVKRDKWVGKAVGKLSYENFPQANQHWGNFAADGYRIHMDHNLERVEGLVIPKGGVIVMAKLRKSRTPAACFKAVDLLRAVQTAKKTNSKYIQLSVRPRTLTVTAKETNCYGNPLRFVSKMAGTHKGKPLSFYIRPQYLIDALSGMEGKVKLKQVEKTIQLVCRSREAIIAEMFPKES